MGGVSFPLQSSTKAYQVMTAFFGGGADCNQKLDGVKITFTLSQALETST